MGERERVEWGIRQRDSEIDIIFPTGFSVVITSPPPNLTNHVRSATQLVLVNGSVLKQPSSLPTLSKYPGSNPIVFRFMSPNHNSRRIERQHPGTEMT